MKLNAMRLINKLVYVRWVDSYGCSPRWEPADNVKPMLLTCESVGWLTYADTSVLLVVPHLTGAAHAGMEKQGCGDMSIPAACVVKLAPIRLGASRV